MGVQWGVFVCGDCCNIHRRNGCRTIKALRNKTQWSEKDVAKMDKLGNLKVNAEREVNIPAYLRKPIPQDEYEIKAAYIRAKYTDQDAENKRKRREEILKRLERKRAEKKKAAEQMEREKKEKEEKEKEKEKEDGEKEEKDGEEEK